MAEASSISLIKKPLTCKDKGANQNGGERQLESRYGPVQRLEPQRWRAAIKGAHVQIVSEPRVGAHES